MKKFSLPQLIKSNDIQDIEKHLAYSFVKAHSLNISKNKFLQEYFKDFVIGENLFTQIQQLNHNSIEDISIDMELLIPSEDKKVNGAFFTPSYIVDYILEGISPSPDAKILDPSCGSGTFLLGIIRYMRNKYQKSINSIICENVFGSDILEYNVNRCKLLITLYALNEDENVDSEDIQVKCKDSLACNWTMRFDAIVGNPPYVKFQDMEKETRLLLMENFKTTTHGTYNLYFAFFELGLSLLTEEGRLGYITPNNYFTSLAGESLRLFFQNKQCVYKIADFNATKVFDVQTYTAITFINKCKNKFIDYSRINEKQTPKKYLKNVNFTKNFYTDLRFKKWRLLCDDERKNIEKIENAGESIGNLFNICVGIATLKDEVYFLSPIKEDDAYFYIDREGKQFQIEKTLTRTLVKISDIKTQKDIEENHRKIIFPYVRLEGKNQVIKEVVLKEKYPKCYEYFESVKDTLCGRDKGKLTFTPYYAYGRTQGLNRTGIKLLTPTFSKHPRFLLDKNIDGFFTNGYGIYFRQKERALFSNPIIEEQNLDVIQIILNSVIMDYYVTKTSVAIEGGYPCYQKNFIERFSIPNLKEEDICSLRAFKSSDDINRFLINKYQINLSSPNLSL